jgi:hypothetical protein
MTRAIYISPDPLAKTRAAALSCGWMPDVPADLAQAVAGKVPCAVVIGGNGVQVFADTPPVTPSVVLNAIAADAALDAAAAAAQAVLDANGDTLRSRAKTALATNATFLALANPTAAQVATQTKALTRQVDALIRLAIGALDNISDS